MHERREFYRANRLQSTAFHIAAQIVKDAHKDANRQQLFPQVLRLVNEYIDTRVDLSDEAVIEDVALTKYQAEIAERIRTALRPVTEDGEPPILPVLDSYRPLPPARVDHRRDLHHHAQGLADDQEPRLARRAGERLGEARRADSGVACEGRMLRP
jgi:hypothetical protein